MAEETPFEPRVDAIARNLDAGQVRDLLGRELDYGCRPQVQRAADGTYSLLVIGTAEQLDGIRRDGFELEQCPQPDRSLYEVGEGDRFEDGRVAPRGLGEKLIEPTPRSWLQ